MNGGGSEGVYWVQFEGSRGDLIEVECRRSNLEDARGEDTIWREWSGMNVEETEGFIKKRAKNGLVQFWGI